MNCVIMKSERNLSLFHGRQEIRSVDWHAYFSRVFKIASVCTYIYIDWSMVNVLQPYVCILQNKHRYKVSNNHDYYMNYNFKYL